MASTRTPNSRSTSAPITRPRRPDLGPFRDLASDAGILLDFDGSLAEIVARPELAVPVEGAREVLSALVPRYRLVAVISGRPSEEVTAMLDVPGIACHGLYGMQGADPEPLRAILPTVERVAGRVPEAWVEDKGSSIAVHYRQTPDPSAAREVLLDDLRPVATSAGLHLAEGKMVVELLPEGRRMKGGTVERLAEEHGLRAVVFAGDDLADLDAFGSLDRLAARGCLILRVAVEGPETPTELVDAADAIVDGPAGLVGLLRQLV